MSQTIADDILGCSNRRETINSKEKGNRNELVAAKWLETWTGEGFTRTPSSGGLRWGKDASFSCGDVVSKNQNFNFPFAVETKALKELHIPEYLPKRSKIYTIFSQAIRDADRAGKLPFVMLRSNGMPAGEYVIFVTDDLIYKWFECLTDHSYRDVVESIGAFNYQEDRYTICSIRSYDFLRVPYKIFAEKLKKA